MQAWVRSIVVTDALVLKHQAISIHSADNRFIVWISFISKYYIHIEQH